MAHEILAPSRYNQGAFGLAAIESAISPDCSRIADRDRDHASVDRIAAGVENHSGGSLWISERGCGEFQAVHEGILSAKDSFIRFLNFFGTVTGAVSKFGNQLGALESSQRAARRQQLQSSD